MAKKQKSPEEKKKKKKNLQQSKTQPAAGKNLALIVNFN